MKPGVWTKGKRTIKGFWDYNWAANNFQVVINVRDALSGAKSRSFTVYDDTPEWNGWKLQRTPIAQLDRAAAS